MLESTMSGLIIFASSGMLVYWACRTFLLLNGSKEEIDDTLESDLLWSRRMLAAIVPPQEIV